MSRRDIAMGIKRYGFSEWERGEGPHERSDGHLVRFEDHEQVVLAKDALIAELERRALIAERCVKDALK